MTEREKPFDPDTERIFFKEIPPENFIDKRNQLPLDLRAFLTNHSKEDYQKMRTILYLSEDNQCGFGLNPDGNLISVFSLEREKGPLLAKEALSRGAKHLSCMGQKLKELYEEVNFVVTKEEMWNEEFAPKYWNYERFGRPNYYEMRLKELNEK